MIKTSKLMPTLKSTYYKKLGILKIPSFFIYPISC